MSQDPPTFTAPPGPAPADSTHRQHRPDSPLGIGSFYIPESGPLTGKHVVIVGFGVQGHHTAARLALEGARLTVIDDGELNTQHANGGLIKVYKPLDARIAARSVDYENEWAAMRGTLLPAHLVSWEPTIMENSAAAGAFGPELRGLRDFTVTSPVDDQFPHRATLLAQVVPTSEVNSYIRRSLEGCPRVEFVKRHIVDADELAGLVREYDADLVVNSTGVEFAAMYDDRKMRLQYGALAWLRMPDDWPGGVRVRDLGETVHGFGHGAHPASSDPLYISHSATRRIAVGGVVWPMKRRQAKALIESGFQVDDEIIDGILERAERHFPELQGLEHLYSTCSIRPGRSKWLFEFDRDEPRLFHCGGPGGSGVTIAPHAGRSIASMMLNKLDSPGC